MPTVIHDKPAYIAQNGAAERYLELLHSGLHSMNSLAFTYAVGKATIIKRIRQYLEDPKWCWREELQFQKDRLQKRLTEKSPQIYHFFFMGAKRQDILQRIPIPGAKWRHYIAAARAHAKAKELQWPFPPNRIPLIQNPTE